MDEVKPEFRGAYFKYSISAQRHIDAVLPFITGRRVAVQAGGHIGQWPVYLAQHFELVYTWEPAAHNFPHLIHNIEIAGVTDKVVAARGLLGETTGTAHVAGNSGSTRRQPNKPGIHPVYRLDDLRLPVCDLIYLDIEDDELLALRGAKDTLKRLHPVIAVEERQGFDGKGGVANYLSGFGYKQVHFYCNDLIFKA